MFRLPQEKEVFNSIFLMEIAVYWRDPINIKSTSQDKRHLAIT